MKVSSNFPALNSIFYIWTDPVLHFFGYLSADTNESHSSADPVKLERGKRRRILGANYRDILVVVGMGFFVIVKNLRKTFARDVQQVRHVVVTRSKNNLTAGV